jgi:hypothetical protein
MTTMLLDDVAGNGDDKQANLVGLKIQANIQDDAFWDELTLRPLSWLRTLALTSLYV